MIGIPLSLVVAFLRPRSALGVLEGAPLHVLSFSGRPHLIAYQPGDKDADVGDAALYLGDGEICPAAEGWAARVLGLSFDERATHIDFEPLSTATLMRDNRLLARWTWNREAPRTLGFREIPFVGAPPPTPAERLAAVLRYEMERAR